MRCRGTRAHLCAHTHVLSLSHTCAVPIHSYIEDLRVCSKLRSAPVVAVTVGEKVGAAVGEAVVGCTAANTLEYP